MREQYDRLTGEAALFTPAYECNSPVVPSDFDRLLEEYRLVWGYRLIGGPILYLHGWLVNRLAFFPEWSISPSPPAPHLADTPPTLIIFRRRSPNVLFRPFPATNMPAMHIKYELRIVPPPLLLPPTCLLLISDTSYALCRRQRPRPRLFAKSGLAP